MYKKRVKEKFGVELEREFALSAKDKEVSPQSAVKDMAKNNEKGSA